MISCLTSLQLIGIVFVYIDKWNSAENSSIVVELTQFWVEEEGSEAHQKVLHFFVDHETTPF